MELVSHLSTLLVGQSAVPNTPGVMGPLQGSAGAIGGGGKLSANIGDLASGGLTMASASLSLFGGSQAGDVARAHAQSTAQALTLRSGEERLQARQEELAAKQSGNAVLDRLNRTLAAQRLAFSANGVDGDFGTGAAIAENAFDAAGDEIMLSRADANMRILARRRQSHELLRQRGIVLARGSRDAAGAQMQGVASGLSALSDLSHRRTRRG